MEEKERYSLEEFDDIDWELAIVDNELGKSLTFEEIKNLLNKQDKRIKELEEEVMVGEFWHSAYKGKELDNDLLLKENQQLKERIGK